MIQLSYSEIWPEFTGQGKEVATVAHLMRHELGNRYCLIIIKEGKDRFIDRWTYVDK